MRSCTFLLNNLASTLGRGSAPHLLVHSVWNTNISRDVKYLQQEILTSRAERFANSFNLSNQISVSQIVLPDLSHRERPGLFSDWLTVSCYWALIDLIPTVEKVNSNLFDIVADLYAEEVLSLCSLLTADSLVIACQSASLFLTCLSSYFDKSTQILGRLCLWQCLLVVLSLASSKGLLKLNFERCPNLLLFLWTLHQLNSKVTIPSVK